MSTIRVSRTLTEARVFLSIQETESPKVIKIIIIKRTKMLMRPNENDFARTKGNDLFVTNNKIRRDGQDVVNEEHEKRRPIADWPDNKNLCNQPREITQHQYPVLCRCAAQCDF